MTYCNVYDPNSSYMYIVILVAMSNNFRRGIKVSSNLVLNRPSLLHSEVSKKVFTT